MPPSDKTRERTRKSTPGRKPGKRRLRTILSCDNCREKKLKCGRERPVCLTCTKLNLACQYRITPDSTGELLEEKKLRLLKEQLAVLEQRKYDLESQLYNDSDSVLFTQILSLFYVIQQSGYIGTISKTLRQTNDVPDTLTKDLAQEQKNALSFDVLKSMIALRDSEKLQFITPYFEDMNAVHRYVKHFFNSEIHSNCYYINKDDIYYYLAKYFGDDGLLISTNGKNMKKQAYLAIGLVLVIIRIAYISFYNCGYESEPLSLKVGPEALNLSILCLEELLFPLHEIDRGAFKLMLLIDYCRRNTNDLVGWVEDSKERSPYDPVKIGKMLELHIDPPSSTSKFSANEDRRLWYTLINIAFQDTIYNGDLVHVGPEEYTTMPPHTGKKNEFASLVDINFEDRKNLNDLIQPLMKMMKNARTIPKVFEYEEYLQGLIEKMSQPPLADIMSMDSSTRNSRIRKVSKFLSFLHIHCIACMIAAPVMLHYDKSGLKSAKHFNMTVRRMIDITGPATRAAYFLDNSNHHYYNLRSHFGHSIEPIPIIILNIHRILTTTKYTLLAKVLYQMRHDKNPKLQTVKSMFSQNCRVLVSMIGKVASHYRYARRLFMIHSYLSSTMFGIGTGRVSETYLENLSKTGTVTWLDEETIDYIVDNMVQLTDDINQDTFKPTELLNAYPGTVETHTNEFMSVDPYFIGKLEKFLDAQVLQKQE